MAGFQLVGMTVMFLVALRLVAGVVPAPDGAPAGVSDGALEDAPAAMVDASEAAGVTAVDELFEDRDEEPAVPEVERGGWRARGHGGCARAWRARGHGGARGGFRGRCAGGTGGG